MPSIESSVATRATDPTSDPSLCRATGPELALGRVLRSDIAWLQVAARAIQIGVALGTAWSSGTDMV